MKPSKPILYRSLQGIAMVAIAFSLVIFMLITATFIDIRNAEPLESPGMSTLRQSLRAASGEQAETLKQEIRDLDRIARHTYFKSLVFTRRGTWLLFAGILVALICMRGMAALKTSPPDPGKTGPPESEIEAARQNRRIVAIGGLGLFLAAVVISSRVNTQLGTSPGAAPEPKPAYVPPPEAVLANWPAFRGPHNLGRAASASFPLSWDGAGNTNVRWKVAIPAPGFNSPVVWQKHLFLSGGTAALREVLCFDTDSGALRWRKPIGTIPGSPPTPPEVMEDVGYAPSTMATDGKHAFAIYPTGDVVAFDFDGNRIWARNIGVPKNAYGYASSLLTHGGLLFIQYDNESAQGLLALHANSGEIAWKQARQLKPSWATPSLVKRDGAFELVLNGNPMTTAYDPATGNLRWEIKCMGGEVAPSPAADGDLVFVTTQYEVLAAIRPGPQPSIAWEADDDLPDISSPVAGNGLLFLANAEGVLTCFETATGKQLWQQEFDEPFISSPILAGDRLYVLDKDGVCHVIRAAKTFELLARNALGEPSTCTPAFVDGRIYIRSEKNLYCIEDRKERPTSNIQHPTSK